MRRVCVSLETTNAELEAQISEARGQVEDLAKKLQAEMTESQHLQVIHCSIIITSYNTSNIPM